MKKEPLSMKTSHILFSISCGLCILFGGCVSGPDIQRTRPDDVRTLTTGFGASDFQQCTNQMVDSMLSSQGLTNKLAKQFGDKTPVLAFGLIENRSYNLGLPLDSLGDSVKIRLINSGKFDVVEMDMNDEITQNILKMMDNPGYNPADVMNVAGRAVQDYILRGYLIELQETNGVVKDVYYKLTFKLFNMRTGKIDWMDEAEIRKTAKRGAIGW
jgi:uncharacterized protein (TIGR02722 family)